MKKSNSDKTHYDSGRKKRPIVDINRELVQQKMDEKGFSQQAVATTMGRISRASVQRIVELGKIRPHRLQSLADALGVLPSSLLASSNYQEQPQPEFVRSPPRDWKIIEYICRQTNAANGVSYCIVKMQSEIIEQNFARGKFYELGEVQPAEEAEILERLKRHATVCESLKNSDRKNIARHRTIVRLAKDTAWWILDDWIEGKTLKSLIAKGTRFKPHQIKTIGTEILIGLNELHQSKMYFRELAPERIYISDDLLKCKLTDFELAKILEKVPTVSGPWLTRNPYRAPENVESKTIAPTNFARTDIYSWAAIVIELFTGDPDAEPEALAKKLSDSQLANYLLTCRSPIFSERPKSVVDVLDVWNQWTTKK